MGKCNNAIGIPYDPEAEALSREAIRCDPMREFHRRAAKVGKRFVEAARRHRESEKLRIAV